MRTAPNSDAQPQIVKEFQIMKKAIGILGFLAFSTLAFGQGGKEAAQTFELMDGGKVVVMKDGTMAHYDAANKRVHMRDGSKMDGMDGSKMMMKNNAIWKQISEHGTLKPGH